jgi:hypothetical protein
MPKINIDEPPLYSYFIYEGNIKGRNQYSNNIEACAILFFGFRDECDSIVLMLIPAFLIRLRRAYKASIKGGRQFEENAFEHDILRDNYYCFISVR